MKNDIQEAIIDLQEDIREKQDQIELIRSINWDNGVDEETWHKLCETPLRTNGLLGRLLKNVFPDAENINVHCNYVYFKMYGFKCALPTSFCRGCYLDTSWYKKDNGKPITVYWSDKATMKKYFEAKDNKESWEILFNYRLPRLKGYRKWCKFLLWFFKYKWKDDHREEWESKFKECEDSFRRNTEKYYATRKEMHDKSKTMIEVLVPELRRFSDKICKLDGSWFDFEKIAELEGLQIQK